MNEKNRPQSVERSNDVTLLDITQILLRKVHWLLLAGIVAAAAVYGAVTIFITPTYESRVSFYVYNNTTNVAQGTINNSDLQAAESLATTYSKILASNSVLDAVLNDLGADTALSRKELGHMVKVSVISDTQLLEVVDRPEVAGEKTAPRTVFDSAIGFVLGVMLVSLIIVLRMLADTTIYLPEDIEQAAGVTVLGQIPEINISDETHTPWRLTEGGSVLYNEKEKLAESGQ